MTAARFIFRLDDICPGMDELKFNRVMTLLKKHQIVPLLGIVPDNQDPALQRQAPTCDWWQQLAQWREQGVVELAQHGYQHRMHPSDQGILNRRYRLNNLTEFAGLSYDQQAERIGLGRERLHKLGLETDIWMAPNHSFDLTTCHALVELGFHAVTDGFGLWPFDWQDLRFVPQQLGRPRTMPLGIWTICIHPNTISEAHLNAMEQLLPRLQCIRFSQAITMPVTVTGTLVNVAVEPFYALARRFKSTAKTESACCEEPTS